MKFVFVYIALVFFTCSCEDKEVNAIAVLNQNGSVVQQPTGPLKTRLLIAKLDANDTNQSSESKQVLPAITAFEVKNTGEATTDNLDLCARVRCAMIRCPNSLPPIPSQGICCPRCISNPNCNASACPQYKCGTYLIPANLTAGECCDRCAPVTNEPKDTSSHTQPPSSSSEEEDDDSGCEASGWKKKQHRIQSRLIRLLSKTLSELRRNRSHRKGESSSESTEN